MLIVFLDILKAFDRVWYPGMLQKLPRIQKRWLCLQTIHQLLTGHEQRAVLGGVD